MRWITDDIIELLREALSEARFDTDPEMTSGEPGGDHDTQRLIIEWGLDERLFVCGFHCTNTNYDEGSSPADMEVEMVEVTDGKDDRGGLTSKERDVCLGYGVVCGTLRKAGFEVVPNMEDYF